MKEVKESREEGKEEEVRIVVVGPEENQPNLNSKEDKVNESNNSSPSDSRRKLSQDSPS